MAEGPGKTSPPGRAGPDRPRLRPGRRADRARRCAPPAPRRGFAQARLRALWPEIAGPEFAAICAPVRLARARGPAGGLLTVAVSGAHAPQLQMLLPLLRERVNAALGPGAVGRIQLTQAGAWLRRAAGRLPARREAPAAAVDLGAVGGRALKHW